MASFVVVLEVPDDLLEGTNFGTLDAITVAHRYMHAMGEGEAPYLRKVLNGDG